MLVIGFVKMLLEGIWTHLSPPLFLQPPIQPYDSHVSEILKQNLHVGMTNMFIIKCDHLEHKDLSACRESVNVSLRLFVFIRFLLIW